MTRKRAAILAAEDQWRGQGRNALRAHREAVGGEKRSGVDPFGSVAATFPDIAKESHGVIEHRLAIADFGRRNVAAFGTRGRTARIGGFQSC